MIDLNRDIHSLSNFNGAIAPSFSSPVEGIGPPGRAHHQRQSRTGGARLRLLSKSFMSNQPRRTDQTLRASIADMKAGRVIPAETMLAELAKSWPRSQAGDLSCRCH